MNRPVKALLYTAGTFVVSLVTLLVGNFLCEQQEKKQHPHENPPSSAPNDDSESSKI